LKGRTGAALFRGRTQQRCLTATGGGEPRARGVPRKGSWQGCSRGWSLEMIEFTMNLLEDAPMAYHADAMSLIASCKLKMCAPHFWLGSQRAPLKTLWRTRRNFPRACITYCIIETPKAARVKPCLMYCTTASVCGWHRIFGQRHSVFSRLVLRCLLLSALCSHTATRGPTMQPRHINTLHAKASLQSVSVSVSVAGGRTRCWPRLPWSLDLSHLWPYRLLASHWPVRGGVAGVTTD